MAQDWRARPLPPPARCRAVGLVYRGFDVRRSHLGFGVTATCGAVRRWGRDLAQLERSIDAFLAGRVF